MHITTVSSVVNASVLRLKLTFTASMVPATATTPALFDLCKRDLGQLSATWEAEYTETCSKCHSYVICLVEAIEARFPKETQSVVHAFSAIYPHGIANTTALELPLFGNDLVLSLCKTYLPDIDPSVVLLEYGNYKFYFFGEYSKSSALKFLHLATHDHHIASNYPNMLVLVTIAATLIHGSVDCERTFSIQNNIKTADRSGLTSGHLNDLLICVRDGPAVDQNSAIRYLKLWKESKKRKSTEN